MEIKWIKNFKARDFKYSKKVERVFFFYATVVMFLLYFYFKITG